jgi:hypothetical protein
MQQLLLGNASLRLDECGHDVQRCSTRLHLPRPILITNAAQLFFEQLDALLSCAIAAAF